MNKYILEKVLARYLEFMLLAVLGILAGYNILYETTDSVVYMGHYNSVSWDSIFGNGVNFEPFYKLLVSFSALILNIEYQLFASLLVFVALSIKFYLFSNRYNSIYLKIAYVLTLYPFYESLRIRAALGIALVFLALELRHKKYTSLTLVLMGVFTHYSLIFFLLFWLHYNYFNNLKNIKKLIKIAVVLGIVFTLGFSYFVQFIDYFDQRLLTYIIDDKGYINIWILPKYLLMLLLSYYMIFNQPKNINLHNTYNIYIFIGTIFLGLSILTFKINLLSLNLLDIGMFSYLLIATNSLLYNKELIRFLFILLILLEVLFRIFQLPVLIIALVRGGT
jgi:hypothetical protein